VIIYAHGSCRVLTGVCLSVYGGAENGGLENAGPEIEGPSTIAASLCS